VVLDAGLVAPVVCRPEDEPAVDVTALERRQHLVRLPAQEAELDARVPLFHQPKRLGKQGRRR
jgi:hypothetical protein